MVILSLPIISFASKSTSIENSLESKKMELVKRLKTIQDNELIDITIKNFLKENKVLNTTKKYKESTKLIIEDGKILNKDFQAYDIGNKGKIIFTDNNLFYTIIPNDNSNTNSSQVSIQNKLGIESTVEEWNTKEVDKTFNTYSWTGIKIFSVRLAGTFEYNGTDSKADIKYGNFKPAFASLWDVGSWNSGDKNYLDDKSKIYAYGVAELDIDVAAYLGIDLNLNTVDINAQILCDKDGRITESYEVDDN